MAFDQPNIAGRPFRAQDADPCFRMRSEAFILDFYEELGPAVVAAAVNAFMPSDYISMAQEMDFFVAESGNEPVGF